METGSTPESTNASQEIKYGEEISKLTNRWPLGLYYWIYGNWDLDLYLKRKEQDGSREGSPEQVEKLNALCLAPRDIADVYLLSLTSNFSHQKEEIDQSNETERSLSFEMYQKADDLAAKHILSGLTWLMSKRSFSRSFSWHIDGDKELDDEVGDLVKNLATMAFEGKSAQAMLNQIPVEKIIGYYLPLFQSEKDFMGEEVPDDDRRDVPYKDFLEGLQELNLAREEAKKTADPRSLIINLTFLHNAIHHSGGAVLEELLAPGEKNMAYNLLLRFASTGDHGNFGINSAKKFASPETRVLCNKLARLSPPFAIHEAAKEYTTEEEGRYLAEELIKETKAQTTVDGGEKFIDSSACIFFDHAAKSLQEYPYFNTLKEVFPVADGVGRLDHDEGMQSGLTIFMTEILNQLIKKPNLKISHAITRATHNKGLDPSLWAGFCENPAILTDFGPDVKKALIQEARRQALSTGFSYAVSRKARDLFLKNTAKAGEET